MIPIKLKDRILGTINPQTGEFYSIASYCARWGHAPNWLYKLYDGETAIARYVRLAASMEVSIDKLILCIELGRFNDLYAEGVRSKFYKSKNDLARKAKVSLGFVVALAEDKGDLKYAASYVNIARDLNMNVEDVCPTEVLDHQVA